MRTPYQNCSTSFPVDAVFTWVDGNDPVWIEEREKCLALLANDKALLPEALNKARFQDNEELRFALRSIARHAPWIRRVHVITAGQKPSWINEKSVNIVHHQEVFPKDTALPVFSNRPIELCAHRIPGLTEQFILFNDDFMLGNTVFPDDFFLADGTPRVWAVQRGKKTMHNILHPQTGKATHSTAITRSHHAVMNRFGRTFPISMRHYPKAMTIATASAVWNTFPGEVKGTLASPFRSTNDITVTMLYPLYLLATQKGILRPVNGLSQALDFLRGRLAHIGASLNDAHLDRKIAMIRRLKPLTFCLNDAPSANETDRIHLKALLRDFFSESCQFEQP